jgi:hypothetical protein
MSASLDSGSFSRRLVQGLQLERAQKKADVAGRFQASHHVGLLFNKPPGTAGLLFS